MHIQTLSILLSVIIVSLLSFIGVLVLLKRGFIEKIIIYLVSFSVGALFGDVFIHLLPEISENFTLKVSLIVLLGIFASFILEKFIHWRHCHVETSKSHPHPFGYVNLVGDGIHNFIDGVLIAGSYLINFHTGLATTIAVVLHEIPQEFGDFGILLHAGFSKAKALFFNFLSAITAIVGAVLTLVIGSTFENLTIYLIAFAAGNFLYLAGSDLVPELHKETKPSKSFLQLVFMILGVIVMLSLVLIE